ncbi:hypothetical protein RHGRI_030087 [Rhododendron griersonianum]|uniref:CASP-like protein n=1 Tax=Rhododendron griersonianum TaxID=479676 RepID=A0AAV6ISK0_9ERIC|nr:hypothetical protein RHGRI_030087 [Rhododendron griersonianum]
MKKVDLLPPSAKGLQLGRFLKKGFLLLTRVIAVTFCVTLAASKAARLGTTTMAAFQICLQVWMTSSLLADGLAVAAQVEKGLLDQFGSFRFVLIELAFFRAAIFVFSLPLKQSAKMQNEEGQNMDLYIPRNSATNRLITAKDHASVQLNVGHLDEAGRYTGQFSTYTSVPRFLFLLFYASFGHS